MEPHNSRIRDLHTLDYGPGVASRRRALRRAIVTVALLLAIGLGTWSATPVIQRYRYQRTERACWQHLGDPSIPAFEEDPNAAAELLKQSQYVSGPSSRNPSHKTALYDPEPWRVVRSANNLRYPASAAVLFIHERANSRGEPRLVVILKPCGSGRQPLVDPMLFKRSESGIQPVDLGMRVAGPWEIPGGSLDDPSVNRPFIRLFQGIPDANDPTHFTIGYEIAGEKGNIDGWLRGTTNDKVEFEVRDGPATRKMELPWVRRILQERR